MTRKPTSRSVSSRAWQRMLSGRRLDLLDPSPLDVEIADIAHGLARVARWNGQTEGAHIFSVAQHTLLVDMVARARWPSLDRLVGVADHRLERRDHVADHVFRRVMQQKRKPPGGRQRGFEVAADGLD